jgi:cyclophilin family peptidyl-prolyl cis-trans isomerase
MRRSKRFLMSLPVAAVLLLVVGCGSSQPASTAPGTASTGGPMKWSNPPAMAIDQNKNYTATIKTNYGDIVVQLFAKDAPKTVNNFVFLSKQGFYNNVKFHRVIQDFMIQTGDPTGTGRGGPGYQFADELPPKRPYGPGIVAMANAGPNTNTNGSQFFICTGSRSADLNSNPYYTIFGQVTSGMDVVLKIASVPVTGPEPSSPTVDVHMVSVSIQESAQ